MEPSGASSNPQEHSLPDEGALSGRVGPFSTPSVEPRDSLSASHRGRFRGMTTEWPRPDDPVIRGVAEAVLKLAIRSKKSRTGPFGPPRVSPGPSVCVSWRVPSFSDSSCAGCSHSSWSISLFVEVHSLDRL
jgi:hypothetical protein